MFEKIDFDKHDPNHATHFLSILKMAKGKVFTTYPSKGTDLAWIKNNYSTFIFSWLWGHMPASIVEEGLKEFKLHNAKFRTASTKTPPY